MRGYIDLNTISRDGRLQVKLQVISEVCAAIHLWPAAAASAAEDIAEYITKDVAESFGSESAMTTTACLESIVAEAIVRGTFLRVFQDFVCFLGLLKLGLGIGVIFIAVRMMFHRQATIGLLYLVSRCRIRDAKNFVVVAFCHALSRLLRFRLVVFVHFLKFRIDDVVARCWPGFHAAFGTVSRLLRI